MAVKSIDAEKQVLQLLQGIGLSQNEAILLKFLVERGKATAVDMNKHLKIRQPQLYDILFSLERKGLLNVIEGRPKIYESVNLEAVIRQMERDLEENRKFLVKWARDFAGKDRTSPAIWMSRTWRSFRNNTASILKDAHESLMIQIPGNFLEEMMEELEAIELEGIRVFLLIYGDGLNRNEVDKFMKRDFLSDVAIMDLGQFFAVVGDSDKSSFMPRNIMEKEKGERYGYIFQDPDMTWFITHNFFMGWFEAEILKRTVAEPGNVYTNQRFALYDITYLLKHEKKEVWVEVDGYDKEAMKEVTISGYVEGVVTTNNLFNFTVTTKTGDSYSVGGYDSKGERIEASRIRISKVS